VDYRGWVRIVASLDEPSAIHAKLVTCQRSPARGENPVKMDVK
jgi:hypothetical protein